MDGSTNPARDQRDRTMLRTSMHMLPGITTTPYVPDFYPLDVQCNETSC